MTKHIVNGARGDSLARQLAGLGLVRILAEQADPDLRCWFDAADLVIDTAVPDLAAWLVDVYEPAPVLSPWNGGSGYGLGLDECRKRNKDLRAGKPVKPERGDTASDSLARLLAHPSERVREFISNHRRIARLAAQARAQDWEKIDLIRAIRNVCSDLMLPWLDTTTVMLENGLKYPPILGSGGNDGRLDFSTNFHQRLLEVLPIDAKTRERSTRLATDWLDGDAGEPLSRAAIGQFDPGAAGTPNSSPFGAAESLVNPWAFVLMIEGSPLFASAPVRRLDSHAAVQPRAAMTFMTEGSEIGSSTATSAEESRGEVWVPWWETPLSYAAIRQLFSEGRAVWRGRTAVRSGQMYLATASRGVSAGVSGFDRYTIVRRNGLAFSAVLADQVRASANDAVLVVAEVEDWPDQVRRRPELPGTVRAALRRFDLARVELVRAATGEERVRRVRDLLAAVTDMELAVGRSGRTREDVPPWPRARAAGCLVKLLGTTDWAAAAGSAEFRIALSLASLATAPLTTIPRGRTMREILLPIDPGVDSRARPAWRPSAVVGGLGQRPLVDILSDVTLWLMTAAPYAAAPDREPHGPGWSGTPGPPVGVHVPAAALHAWLADEVDEPELTAWFRALLALDWRDHRYVADLPELAVGAPIDPVLATLGPFRDGVRAADDDVRYALTTELITQLVSGHTERAHRATRQRLRQLGYAVVSDPVELSHLPDHGKRLAAALLPRVPRGSVASAFNCVAYRLRADDSEANPTKIKERA